MSYRLYVRPLAPFTAPGQQQYSWVLQDAGGATQAKSTCDNREAIEQTLTQSAVEKVELIGLIPADETVCCWADIPARQGRLVAQALPYAVEEQVAQDIDTLHLALGQHTAHGYQVAAIDKVQMAHWWQLFSGWQSAPLTALYPDAALLPVTEHGWTLCLTEHSVLMLNEQEEWLAIQPGNLAAIAQTMAAPFANNIRTDTPVRLYGSGPEQERQRQVIHDFTAANEQLRVTPETLDMSVTELLGWSHYQQHCQPINLCQGAFSMQPAASSWLSQWTPLLAVAAVWFVVQVAVETGVGVYYQHQADQWREQAMAIYHEAFPDDQRTHPGNVKRVVQGQLRVAASGTPQTGFIALLRFTGDEYRDLPNPEAVSFNSINYSRNRGELVVDLRADSYDRMSRLRKGLTDAGLEAQIGSVINEAGGARGRLTVSGGQ